MPIQTGQRVRLPANVEEELEEEYGEVAEITVYSKDKGDKKDDVMLIVYVDKKYRTSSADDGMREVALEDVEPT